MFDFCSSEVNAITDKLVFVIWPGGRKKEQKPHNKCDAWNAVWMMADVHYNISSDLPGTDGSSYLFNQKNIGFSSCIWKVTLFIWIKYCSAQFSYQTLIRGWPSLNQVWNMLMWFTGWQNMDSCYNGDYSMTKSGWKLYTPRGTAPSTQNLICIFVHGNMWSTSLIQETSEVKVKVTFLLLLWELICLLAACRHLVALRWHSHGKNHNHHYNES